MVDLFVYPCCSGDAVSITSFQSRSALLSRITLIFLFSFASICILGLSISTCIFDKDCVEYQDLIMYQHYFF